MNTQYANCAVCGNTVLVQYSRLFSRLLPQGSYKCASCGSIEHMGDSVRIGDRASSKDRARFLQSIQNNRCRECENEQGMFPRYGY